MNSRGIFVKNKLRKHYKYYHSWRDFDDYLVFYHRSVSSWKFFCLRPYEGKTVMHAKSLCVEYSQIKSHHCQPKNLLSFFFKTCFEKKEWRQFVRMYKFLSNHIIIILFLKKFRNVIGINFHHLDMYKCVYFVFGFEIYLLMRVWRLCIAVIQFYVRNIYKCL